MGYLSYSVYLQKFHVYMIKSQKKKKKKFPGISSLNSKTKFLIGSSKKSRPRNAMKVAHLTKDK